MLMHTGPLDPMRCSKNQFKKNHNMADCGNLKNVKCYLCSSSTDFDKIWYDDAY